MCTDCDIIHEKGRVKIKGEPTEIALVDKAIKEGKDKNELYEIMPRVSEIP